MKDFSKLPTDAAIIKAFNKFEDAFNVADAILRIDPDRACLYGSLQEAEADRDILYQAHRVMHNLALQAAARKEAEKK